MCLFLAILLGNNIPAVIREVKTHNTFYARAGHGDPISNFRVVFPFGNGSDGRAFKNSF